MANVKLIGRIIPEYLNISYIGLPTVHWEDSATGAIGSTMIEIRNSIITADCSMKPFDGGVNLRYCYSFAHVLVDLTAFASGVGLFVYFDKAIYPDGETSNLLVTDRSLQELCSAYSIAPGKELSLIPAFKIVAGDPELWNAFRDLAVTINSAQLTPINCARAIEILRHKIAPGKPKEKGWVALREALNIDVSYLKSITTHSEGPRHGDPNMPPWEETVKIRNRTWMIMNRFLEYRKRAITLPLPLDEFPLLTL